MKQLSDWIDLENAENLNAFTCLLGNPSKQVGVYDHLKTKEDLLYRLQEATVEIFHTATTQQPSVLKLYDIDIGTPLSTTSTHLADLLSTNKIDPLTPVHLRYFYGGLFLFLLKGELQKTLIKSDHTYVALDTQKKEPWLVRLGAFTQPNQVWSQHRFDGKTTTLDKAIKVPYLKTFSIVNEEDLDTYDVPW